MKTIRFLQVGDIHFPESSKESLADIKDLVFPPTLTDTMLLKPLQTVLRAVTTEVENSGVDGLLFCGDLTSRGRVDGYEACLDYLIESLDLGKWKPERIHAVPGNHDVDRSRVDPTGRDLFAKFSPFENAWLNRNLPVLAVKEIRSSEIIAGKNKAAVYSVNSSLGCGERRHLPSPIAEELAVLLDSYVTRAGWERAFELVGEILDTPGFRQADIETLCSSIRALTDRTIPLVVTHHNLLPQAILRIQLYTEVMNAGLVRSRITHLHRPVIYCHGHVHDDPIEIVIDPIETSSRMISVSAPELKRGFNIIQIEFGIKGFPLGCRVQRYQLSSRDGDIACFETPIPFYPSGYRHAKVVGHDRIGSIIAKLPDTELRFADVLEKLKSPSPSVNRTTVIDALREAEWLGFIEITDRAEQVDYWRIRKVGR